LIDINTLFCGRASIEYHRRDLVMIQNILVHIPTERPVQPVVDAAISMARYFDAHLTAISTGYIATSAAFVLEGAGAAAVAATLEVEQRRAGERTAAALSVFEAQAKAAGISFHCRSIEDIPVEASAAVCAAARLHDLTVVLQPDSDHVTFDNTIVSDILLGAGGAVFFVPYIFKGPFTPKRIGICWDGSRLAARALRDADPFLRQAESLVALAINTTEAAPAEASLNKLGSYLARYDHPTRLVDIPAQRSNIQPSLLSMAADADLDMLVMGAYGHSPLKEGILGGVTREMLQVMTIPTLMSH
jgi:nucleotide-binding universal stress UspA family protein